MWNLTENIKYKKYVFNYNWLEKIYKLLNAYYTQILDLNPFDGKGTYLFSQSHEIISIVGDLIISSDKLLSENNLSGFVSTLSMAYELILKYGLIIANYKNAKDGSIDENLHKWNNIKLFKLENKISNIFKNKDIQIFEYIKNKLDAKLFNDIKHLNHISTILFHKGLSKEEGYDIDSNGAWVDWNSYHFGCMEQFSYAIDSMLLIVNEFAKTFILKIGIDGNINYSKIAVWLSEYISNNNFLFQKISISKNQKTRN